MAAFPIRSDSDLTRAFERIDELWGTQPGTPDGDELDIMLQLVEAWEARHHPIPAGNPVDVIRFKMAELGLTQNALARRARCGSGRISEILAGRRRLTVALVHALASALEIAPGLLLGEVPGVGGVELEEDAIEAATVRARSEGTDLPTWTARVLGRDVGSDAPPPFTLSLVAEAA